MDFDTLDNTLTVVGTPIPPSYIHGAMVGLLCTNQHTPSICWDLLQNEIMLENECLNKLFVSTIENLSDVEQGIELILPTDDLPMTYRLEALADWCEGFLKGMKLAELPSGTLISMPIVTEIVEDFAQIKEVSYQERTSEENEKRYVEIVEFVRVGVLLIYAECQQACDNPQCQSVH